MPKNLPGHWVVDVVGGFELSPRGDSMHSIERINQTSLCRGFCPAYDQLASLSRFVGVLKWCFEGGHLASCIKWNDNSENMGCMEAKNSKQPCELKVEILGPNA
jgi:hypothetical protein